MKKFQAVFLFMFLIACSPGQTTLPTVSGSAEQTSIPITQEIASTSTTLPTATPVSLPPPTTTSTSIPTPIGGGSGKIAFTSEQDGGQGIYVINADGSGLIELASEISSKFNPAWTLDGTKVSFSSSTENSASLYIMDADSSNLAKVLDTSEISAYDQISPDSVFGIGCCSSFWSPDGEKIIFKTSRGVGRVGQVGHIHTLNLNNNQMFDFRVASWSTVFWSSDSMKFGVIGCEDVWLCTKNIADAKPVNLNGIENVTFPSNLYWSPDGKKITFAGFWNSKNTDVYVMNADFSDPINISRYLVNGQNGWPVWSPDSKKVAFSSCDVYLCELYIMKADGSSPVKLTSQILGLSSVVWSPDSSKIVYVSTESGNDEIYMANSYGNNTVNLTNNSAQESNPVWSPDATKVAFVSDRDGHDEIYILDVRDMSLFRLTKIGVNNYSPVWLP
jgi:Tol biopolymer transport system component